MKKLRRFLGAALVVLLGCAGSAQYEVVQERYDSYLRVARDYQKLEEKYQVILFNLERMPQDSFLIAEQKICRQELEHLHTLMQQSRLEYEEMLTRWEDEIRKEQGVKQPPPQRLIYPPPPPPPQQPQSKPESKLLPKVN